MREDLRQWMSERCVMEVGARVRAQDLYKSFIDWKTSKMQYATSLSEWGREMKNCPNVTKVKSCGRMVYRGIRLRGSV